MAKDGRKLHTRRRILTVALRHFARHGFAGATISTIAHRAKVANSTVFWHFRTKEGLYAAAVELAGERLVRAITDGTDQSFRVVGRQWIITLGNDSDASRLLRSLGSDHRNQAVRQAATSVHALFVEVWLKWLSCDATGVPGSPTPHRTALARLIVASITGLVATRLDRRDEDEIVGTALDQLARWIDADNGAVLALPGDNRNQIASDIAC